LRGSPGICAAAVKYCRAFGRLTDTGELVTGALRRSIQLPASAALIPRSSGEAVSSAAITPRSQRRRRRPRAMLGNRSPRAVVGGYDGRPTMGSYDGVIW
jgi:hypothetical protein